MMKIKNNSITKTFLLIIGLLILVIAAATTIFYIDLANHAETPTLKIINTNNKKVDTSIHDTDIQLTSLSDLDKLPSYTPKSFKSYILSKLKNNNPRLLNIDDCGLVVSKYLITKISQVNIIGGVVPVDSSNNSKNCIGGYPTIWAINSNGVWGEGQLNGPYCTTNNGGKIYEEFVKECYQTNDVNSFVKNPNGSITSLEK